MLEAFAAGCGGVLASTTEPRLQPGAAAFYGVRPAWRGLWEQAKREGRWWYYLDNAWFDVARERYFRIGVNTLQSWAADGSSSRLHALGVKIAEHPPWNGGAHVVLCRQSDEFMRCVAGYAGGAEAWQQDMLAGLKAHTDRPVVIRGKHTTRPLAQDLAGARCLVTHSSAAAIEAVLAGVMVIVTDENSAAAGFSRCFRQIDDGFCGHPGVHEWAARLAASQWTLDELRAGAANDFITGAA